MKRVVVALLEIIAIVALSSTASAAPGPKPRRPVDGRGEVTAESGEQFDEMLFLPGADDINSISLAHVTCKGCHWRFVPACWRNTPDVEDGVLCLGFTANCPPGSFRWFMYWFTPEDGLRFMGARCLDLTAGTTGRELGAAARDKFKDMDPPPAKPALEHATVPLVNLATYFGATGDKQLTDHLVLAGLRLDVIATPEYTWQFGDGTSMTTEQQGRRYQNGDDPRHAPSAADAIMHWYETPGAKAASVTTTWTATYTISGGGQTSAAIPVDGAITLPAQDLAVDVHEGHAVLYN